MGIEYIGKTLLIDKKILVIGDLHLGFERVLRESGIMLPMNILEDIIKDFDLVFKRVGKVEKVVLLGDIKHDFGRNEIDEYREIGEIVNYLRRKCDEIIIVKGNHDAVLEGVVSKLEKVRFLDYYLWEECAFIHGDKDFDKIHAENLKTWVMGHGHPAVNLNDGTKIEKYKCFLIGKYRKKKVIVVPSFFSMSDGTDPREFKMKFAWDLKLDKFDVKIIGENLEVLDFGKLGKI